MPSFATSKPVSPILQPGNINTGLVLGMPFVEGGGTTVNDYSGMNNNGTFSGGVSWTDGPWGKCLGFDNTGYINLGVSTPYLAINVPFTIVWTEIVTATGFTYPARFRLVVSGGLEAFGILRSDSASYGGITAFYSGGAGTRRANLVPTPTASLGIANWFAVVGTSGPNVPAQFLFYWNGQPTSGVTGAAANFGTNTLSRIGYDGADDGTNAIIDNPRVWNRALSSQEIAQDYADSFAWCKPSELILKSPPAPAPQYPASMLQFL